MNEIEQKLTELFLNGSPDYQSTLSSVKAIGCKVMRNSKGEHKITYNTDDVYNVFQNIQEQRQRRNIDAFMRGFLS